MCDTLCLGIRAVLDPFEAELWGEADTVAGDDRRQREFAGRTGRRLVEVMERLAEERHANL